MLKINFAFNPSNGFVLGNEGNFIFEGNEEDAPTIVEETGFISLEWF